MWPPAFRYLARESQAVTKGGRPVSRRASVDLAERTLRLTGRTAAIGLDIGSSAVRAVELSAGTGRHQLRAVAQVGLPPGAVVEGEVRQPEIVAEALRRLWSEGGFSSRRVVAAVGGQRVIVREAQVTAMSASDFRSAMSFEVQDLIPIPVADAVLDFQILGPGQPAPDGRDRMRILLAAADRQAVDRLLGTLEQASLEAVGLDVHPLAALRAISTTNPGPACLVTIGAQLTVVTMKTADGGLLNRTLAIGSERMTAGLGLRLGVTSGEAEAVKRYATSSAGSGAARAAALVEEEAEPLVSQIIESIDYFQSQTGIDTVEELLVSGGGALTSQLLGTLGRAAGVPVSLVDPFAAIDNAVEIEVPDIDRAKIHCLSATGLAMWGAETPDARISLLPASVIEARRRRKALTASGVAAAVLVAGLGGLWFQRHESAAHLRAQAASIEAQSQALKSSSSSLGAVTSYFNAVAARRQALHSIGAGVDWPSLMREISAAMPASATLTSVNLTASTGTAGTTATSGTSATSATGTPAGAPGALAQLTMSVSAAGGVEAVATWLRSMATVPALTNVLVASSSSNGTTTTFTCSATVGPKAPRLTYSWETKK